MVVNKNILGKVNHTWKRLQRGFPCPGICYLCAGALKQYDLFICAPCKNNLPLNACACPVCALPVTRHGVICGACLQAKPRPIRNTFALFRYMFPVNRLIQDMKFHARIEVAAFLGYWMAQFACAKDLSMPQCFIPVPLHNSRVVERGYNQALEIARAAGSMLGIPVCHNICNRIINTPPQSAVSAILRRRNLKGAFALSKDCASLPEHVVIIDDVITTGATVNELAHVLRDGGIERVDVWASARTL